MLGAIFQFLGRILPWFSAYFSKYLAGIFAFFVGYMSKKAALTVSAVALFAALQASFIVGIQLLFSSIAVTAPPFIVVAWSWVAPANALVCLTAILGAHAARYIYDLNKFSLLNIVKGLN